MEVKVFKPFLYLYQILFCSRCLGVGGKPINNRTEEGLYDTETILVIVNES